MNDHRSTLFRCALLTVLTVLAAGPTICHGTDPAPPVPVAPARGMMGSTVGSAGAGALKFASPQPPVPRPPLVEACANGDLAQVKTLLDAGAEVNIAGRSRMTPLMAAAKNGHAAVAEMLIAAGAEVDAMNPGRLTALFYAAMGDHIEVVETLLAHGADMDRTDSRRKSVLLYAADSGAVPTMTYLLSQKARFDPEAESTQQVFLNAASKGYPAVVKAFLEKGVAPDIRNSYRQTAATLGARACRLETMQLLGQYGADLKATTNSGANVLIIAAESGCLEIAQFAVEKGLSIESATADDNRTALIAAASNGHPEVIAWLLAHKADVTVADKWGRTPLIHAAMKGCVACVKRLLAAGATMDAVDAKGNSAFTAAIMEGKTAVFDHFMATGTEVNRKNPRDGSTPLMVACRFNRRRMAERLIMSGADVESAYYLPTQEADRMAVNKMRTADGTYLITIHTNGLTPLMEASQQGHEQIVALLVENGADVDASDKFGNSAFIVAAMNGRVDIMEMLAARGANIDQRNVRGESAYYHAKKNGYAKLEKWLLAKGVSTEIALVPEKAAATQAPPDIMKLFAQSAKDRGDTVPTGFLHFEAGNKLMGENQTAQAIAEYDKAIENHPVFDQAFCNRGVAWERMGKPEKAIADFDAAIRINPRLVDAYINRAGARIGLGQLESAQADYDKALSLNPKHAVAYYNRATLLARTGKPAAAVNDFSRAIELEPAFVAAYNSRGMAYATLGDDAQAIAEYEKAISLNPYHAYALSNMGNALVRIGDVEKALAAYSRALDIKSFAAAYDGRGDAYFQMKQHEQAMADYRAAIALAPGYCAPYFGMARILLLKETPEDLQKALEAVSIGVQLLAGIDDGEAAADGFCAAAQVLAAGNDKAGALDMITAAIDAIGAITPASKAKRKILLEKKARYEKLKTQIAKGQFSPSLTL